MKQIIEQSNDAQIDRTKDLMAIVLCEVPATAPRACALLYRVGLHAGTEGRLTYNWWTFGVLASASLRQAAVNQAAAADIVIVAAREGPGLPESVKDWISLWLATGEYHHRRRALVALLEPDPEQHGASQGMLAQLKQLAEADGVDFFANGEDVGWDAALARGPVPSPGNWPWCESTCGTWIAGRTGEGPVGTGGHSNQSTN
jgi:hypothetical protein